jgi:hypothetical protein
MVWVQIKHVECAITDGRLDEAFDLVRREEIRSHHRGQQLVSKLIEAYVERGRAHFQSRRLAQAFADGQKAHQLGGNKVEIAELLVEVTQAIAERNTERPTVTAIPRPTSRVEPIEAMETSMNGFDAERFYLRVEAAGTFLVARPAVVTIGPVSGSYRPTVGLLAGPTIPIITIERVDEDYFVRGEGSVPVNDRPVRNHLLHHEDRIGVGPRGRIKFRRPYPASTSAVLEFSGLRFPQSDLKSVILMDRELVIGPEPTCHIQKEDLREKVVLFFRNGVLTCRTGLEIFVDGRPMAASAGLMTDRRVKIGALAFTIGKV